jgi:carboxymethylenebutenolidase
MGQAITLTAEDGHSFSAYRVAPTGKPKAGIVVIQEIFGVNSHIKKVSDGFAADGYAPEDIDRGRAVRGKIDINDMIKDIRAAVGALKAEGLKVGVVGYCLGGTLAWLAATRIDGVSCAVSYYGGGVAETASEKPRAPVLFHFGETDQSIPPDHHVKIRAAHPTVPMHIYPAGHGFNCEARGSYHEPSATLARTRTMEFLAKHL